MLPRFRNCRATAHGGKRPDLGNVYFRSSWEANYARILNVQLAQGVITKWEYEPETFVFEKITRGNRTYTPDFRLTCRDGRVIYHEVKGWLDPASKTKLKRMARYYPDVPVLVIPKSTYQVLAKTYKASIPEWED